jgi:hypothetical protein
MEKSQYCGFSRIDKYSGLLLIVNPFNPKPLFEAITRLF